MVIKKYLERGRVEFCPSVGNGRVRDQKSSCWSVHLEGDSGVCHLAMTSQDAVFFWSLKTGYTLWRPTVLGMMPGLG